MSEIILSTDLANNGCNHIYLNIISLAAIVSGLLVIISKNPIVSVLFLIGLFLTIAAYLMMLGLNFIGLSYLLVYVGAVSILFLFILMLINVRISELVTNTSNSLPLAVLIGIIFNSIIYIDSIVNFTYNISKGIIYIKEVYFNSNSIIYYLYSLTPKADSIKKNYYFYNHNLNTFERKSFEELNYVSSNTWEGSLIETSHISALGNVIYTSYSIWLIITSLILLLAMVGAIVITIKQKEI